jgi:hypothetical protein
LGSAANTNRTLSVSSKYGAALIEKPADNLNALEEKAVVLGSGGKLI